jgi:hypothetical protein
MVDRSRHPDETTEIVNLRAIIREECTAAIRLHLAECPLNRVQVEPRLRTVETRLATLIGLVVGSGILGGATGAMAAKLFA